MSRTTTNLGLTAVTNSETLGNFSDAMNTSGGNLDIIDAKMGAVGNTSLQAQVTALNSKLPNVYRWMDATRTGITQASGANYWTLTTTFPAKTGYSRRIMHMETTNQNVIVVRCNINADGSVTVYTYNLSSTSQNFDINGVFAYLADANKES